MIVKVKAPEGVRRAHYGALTMLVEDDGTIAVPAYVGKALCAAGFTCDLDLSKVGVRSELSAAEKPELGYFITAHRGTHPHHEEDHTAVALDLFDKLGDHRASHS